MLRLSFDDEISVTFQEFRHMCGGRSEKSDTHSESLPGLFGPFHLMSVIDEGTQNKREISFENAVPRNSHLMAGLGKNRGQIAGMDTRHILIELAGSFDPPSCP